MRNTAGILALSIGLIYGADQQQPSYINYSASCVMSWLANKLALGVAFDKAMAFPTDGNLADFWHTQLTTKTASPSKK